MSREGAADELLKRMGLEGHPASSMLIGDILAALDAAYAEGLMEAAKVVRECAGKQKQDDVSEIVSAIERLAQR